MFDFIGKVILLIFSLVILFNILLFFGIVAGGSMLFPHADMFDIILVALIIMALIN